MSGMTRVRGKGHTTMVSVTRPADTTAYTAGDVVGAGATLIFNNATFGEFESAILRQVVVTSSATVSPAPDLELWLFDTTVAAVADNAAFTITDAEIQTLIAIVLIPVASWKASALNQACVARDLKIPFNTKKGKSEIFGVLVARNAYVPTSAEVFTIRLQVTD